MNCEAALQPSGEQRTSRWLSCAGRLLDLGRPQVMGVLNVTPDSFSDGGRFLAHDQALTQARRMVAEGASIIDIGGESTRPGAAPVAAAEECARVVPVVTALAQEYPELVISIDSMKPQVMQAAVDAGARMINDVNALRAPGAVDVAVRSGAAVCLMHMQGEPRTMQDAPHYVDVVSEVGDYLHRRAMACQSAGVAAECIVIDPGFGFGKTLAHNLRLLRHLDALCATDYPLLVGMSRKRMFGELLDVPPLQRGYGHAAALALALWQGACLVRTHDVAATVQAVQVATAVMQAQ